MSEGVRFLSQTDTEVIVHQYEKNFKEIGNEFGAFKKTIKELKGAYALLLITKSDDKKIFFAKNGSPLIVGDDGGEIYFGSSDAALLGKAEEVIYLNDGEYGYTTQQPNHQKLLVCIIIIRILPQTPIVEFI